MTLTLALAQMNTRLGDVPANLEKHLALAKEARASGAELAIFAATSLMVPAGLEVQFVGARPAVLAILGDATINGRLSADGKRLSGKVSRPSWQKLTPRERSLAAHELAKELKRRGIEHAELLAYRGRAIQIDFGSVVYVDDTP